MRRLIAGVAALAFILTGYKTQPDKDEFVGKITDDMIWDYSHTNQERNTLTRIMSEIDDFQPRDFIESCIDGSIVVKSFGLFDVAKLPNGEGLGTVALGAVGKVWTFGEKLTEQVVPMLSSSIEDVINQASQGK